MARWSDESVSPLPPLAEAILRDSVATVPQETVFRCDRRTLPLVEERFAFPVAVEERLRKNQRLQQSVAGRPWYSREPLEDGPRGAGSRLSTVGLYAEMRRQVDRDRADAGNDGPKRDTTQWSSARIGFTKSQRRSVHEMFAVDRLRQQQLQPQLVPRSNFTRNEYWFAHHRRHRRWQKYAEARALGLLPDTEPEPSPSRQSSRLTQTRDAASRLSSRPGPSEPSSPHSLIPPPPSPLSAAAPPSPTYSSSKVATTAQVAARATRAGGEETRRTRADRAKQRLEEYAARHKDADEETVGYFSEPDAADDEDDDEAWGLGDASPRRQRDDALTKIAKGPKDPTAAWDVVVSSKKLPLQSVFGWDVRPTSGRERLQRSIQYGQRETLARRRARMVAGGRTGDAPFRWRHAPLRSLRTKYVARATATASAAAADPDETTAAESKPSPAVSPDVRGAVSGSSSASSSSASSSAEEAETKAEETTKRKAQRAAPSQRESQEQKHQRRLKRRRQQDSLWRRVFRRRTASHKRVQEMEADGRKIFLRRVNARPDAMLVGIDGVKPVSGPPSKLWRRQTSQKEATQSKQTLMESAATMWREEDQEGEAAVWSRWAATRGRISESRAQRRNQRRHAADSDDDEDVGDDNEDDDDDEEEDGGGPPQNQHAEEEVSFRRAVRVQKSADATTRVILLEQFRQALEDAGEPDDVTRSSGGAMDQIVVDGAIVTVVVSVADVQVRVVHDNPRGPFFHVQAGFTPLGRSLLEGAPRAAFVEAVWNWHGWLESMLQQRVVDPSVVFLEQVETRTGRQAALDRTRAKFWVLLGRMTGTTTLQQGLSRATLDANRKAAEEKEGGATQWRAWLPDRVCRQAEASLNMGVADEVGPDRWLHESNERTNRQQSDASSHEPRQTPSRPTSRMHQSSASFLSQTEGKRQRRTPTTTTIGGMRSTQPESCSTMIRKRDPPARGPPGLAQLRQEMRSWRGRGLAALASLAGETSASLYSRASMASLETSGVEQVAKLLEQQEADAKEARHASVAWKKKQALKESRRRCADAAEGARLQDLDEMLQRMEKDAESMVSEQCTVEDVSGAVLQGDALEDARETALHDGQDWMIATHLARVWQLVQVPFSVRVSVHVRSSAVVERLRPGNRAVETEGDDDYVLAVREWACVADYVTAIVRLRKTTAMLQRIELKEEVRAKRTSVLDPVDEEEAVEDFADEWPRWMWSRLHRLAVFRHVIPPTTLIRLPLWHEALRLSPSGKKWLDSFPPDDADGGEKRFLPQDGGDDEQDRPLPHDGGDDNSVGDEQDKPLQHDAAAERSRKQRENSHRPPMRAVAMPRSVLPRGVEFDPTAGTGPGLARFHLKEWLKGVESYLRECGRAHWDNIAPTLDSSERMKTQFEGLSLDDWFARL